MIEHRNRFPRVVVVSSLGEINSQLVKVLGNWWPWAAGLKVPSNLSHSEILYMWCCSEQHLWICGFQSLRDGSCSCTCKRILVQKTSLPAYLWMSLPLQIVEELTRTVALTLAGPTVCGPSGATCLPGKLRKIAALFPVLVCTPMNHLALASLQGWDPAGRNLVPVQLIFCYFLF